MGLELVTHFKKMLAIHILDHIHEWKKYCSLCKAHIEANILKLFFRSLIYELSKDVAFTYPENKEEAISKAQKFELLYMQSRYLYHVLLDSPRLEYFRQ